MKWRLGTRLNLGVGALGEYPIEAKQLNQMINSCFVEQ